MTEANRREKLSQSFYATSPAETQTHDLLILSPTPLPTVPRHHLYSTLAHDCFLNMCTVNILWTMFNVIAVHIIKHYLLYTNLCLVEEYSTGSKIPSEFILFFKFLISIPITLNVQNLLLLSYDTTWHKITAALALEVSLDIVLHTHHLMAWCNYKLACPIVWL